MKLFEGDFAALQSMYPDVGASAVIRNLIRAHLDKVEAEAKRLPSLQNA